MVPRSFCEACDANLNNSSAQKAVPSDSNEKRTGVRKVASATAWVSRQRGRWRFSRTQRHLCFAMGNRIAVLCR